MAQARAAGANGRRVPASELCEIAVRVLRTIPVAERSKRAKTVLGKVSGATLPISDGWLTELRASIGSKRMKAD